MLLKLGVNWKDCAAYEAFAVPAIDRKDTVCKVHTVALREPLSYARYSWFAPQFEIDGLPFDNPEA